MGVHLFLCLVQEHLVDSETELAVEQIKKSCQKVQSTLLATNSSIPFQALQHPGEIPPTSACEATTSISSANCRFFHGEDPVLLTLSADLISSSGNSIPTSEDRSSKCITTNVGGCNNNTLNNNHQQSKSSSGPTTTSTTVCLHTYGECASRDSSQCTATGNAIDLHLSCKECFQKRKVIVSHPRDKNSQRKCGGSVVTYGNKYVFEPREDLGDRIETVTSCDKECDISSADCVIEDNNNSCTPVLLDSLVISNDQCFAEEGLAANCESVCLISAHALQKSSSERKSKDTETCISDISKDISSESSDSQLITPKSVCQSGEPTQYFIPTHFKSRESRKFC